MNHLATKDHVSLTANTFIIIEITTVNYLSFISGHITRKKMSVAYQKSNQRLFEPAQKPITHGLQDNANFRFFCVF